MIWDRELRGPAKLGLVGLACDLSEEQARKLLVQLKLARGEE